ncbi:unnamed protein product [Lota lota]
MTARPDEPRSRRDQARQYALETVDDARPSPSQTLDPETAIRFIESAPSHAHPPGTASAKPPALFNETTTSREGPLAVPLTPGVTRETWHCSLEHEHPHGP